VTARLVCAQRAGQRQHYIQRQGALGIAPAQPCLLVELATELRGDAGKPGATEAKQPTGGQHAQSLGVEAPGNAGKLDVGRLTGREQQVGDGVGAALRERAQL